MVLVFCTSSYKHICMYQAPYQSFLYFPRYMSRTDIHYGKKWLRGDNFVNTQGMSVILVQALSLTAIYL